MSILNFLSGLIIGGLLLTVSCSQSPAPLPTDAVSVNAAKSNYDKAVQSGIQGDSYPGQFNRLFPGAMNGISYYIGGAGQTSWYSKAGLFGRYVLTMTAPVTFDSTRTKIVSVGVPSFFLVKLGKISILPDGRFSINTDMSTDGSFSIDTWQKLVAANGNFKAAGLEVETNSPIEHFQEAWRKY